MPEPIIATHEESTAATEPISPETPLTPEEQHDAANRFTDAELLGRSYPVRRLVKTIGNERVHAWESAKAGVANAWDTPGKLIRQGLHDRASRKVDEINANHKAERDAALQSGVSNRLLQHRLNRIDSTDAQLAAVRDFFSGLGAQHDRLPLTPYTPAIRDDSIH